MKAVRIHAPGPADLLRVEDIPVPSPGPGQLLVRIEAAGVNFIDVYKRTGLYPIPLPATLGEEGAGTVVAVGPEVQGVAPGARVAWAMVLGAYAEFALVPAARAVPLPEGVSGEIGAAVMLQGMTAHYLATTTYPLEPGVTCLVHAAAGGVGLLLVQIAKRRGARVIATAGSDAKAELARGAGADEVIVYTQQDFAAEVKRLTAGRGVQVIYDSVGKSTFLPGLDALTPRGMMVLFGASSGPPAPIDPQILNQKGSLFLTRPSLGAYIATRDELLHRSGEIFNWIRSGHLKVLIGAEFRLDQAAAAQQALEGRKTSGKVLLRIHS
jgi:NADPH:quinone reductase